MQYTQAKVEVLAIFYSIYKLSCGPIKNGPRAVVGRRAVVWTPLLCMFVFSTRDLIIFNVILTILLFYLQPVGGVKEHNSEFWGDEPFRGVICTDKGTPGQKHTAIRQSLSSLLCANTSAVRTM